MYATPQRRCQGPCAQDLPWTSEHFAPDTKAQPPLSDWCHKCTALKQEYLAREEQKQQLQAIAASGLKLIHGKLDQKDLIPHSADLVEAFYRAFGGVDGVALMAMQQYLAAKPGSYGRTRILELIVRITIQNVQAGGATKPLDLWNQEELEAELQKRLQIAAVKVIDGRMLNVQKEAV